MANSSMGSVPKGCLVLVDLTGSTPRRILIERPTSFVKALERMAALLPHVSSATITMNFIDKDQEFVEITPEVWNLLEPGPEYLYIRLKGKPCMASDSFYDVPGINEKYSLSTCDDTRNPTSVKCSSMTSTSSILVKDMSGSHDSTSSQDELEYVISDDDELEYPPDVNELSFVVEHSLSRDFDTPTTVEIKEDIDGASGERNAFVHRETRIVWAKIFNWPWWPAEVFLNSDSGCIPKNIRDKGTKLMDEREERLHIVQFFQNNRDDGWTYVSRENIRDLGVSKTLDEIKLEDFFSWIRNRRVWEEEGRVEEFYKAYQDALESLAKVVEQETVALGLD